MFEGASGVKMTTSSVKMNVSTYEDLGRMEREIKRLLRCNMHRTPVCLTAEPYLRFRCSILEVLSGSMEVHQAFSVYLEQGLVARASTDPDGSGNIRVSLGWQQHKHSLQE
jgi:hypothetical protein